jgi:hypothetical protein
MSEPNLAIVFGPNLLRPKQESMLKLIEDAQYVNGITLTMIEEYEFLIAVWNPFFFTLVYLLHHMIIGERFKQTNKNKIQSGGSGEGGTQLFIIT